jgi:hypothetical protein
MFGGLRRCGMEDIGGLYVDKLSSPVGIVHGEDDMGIFLLFRIPVEQ